MYIYGRSTIHSWICAFSYFYIHAKTHWLYLSNDTEHTSIPHAVFGADRLDHSRPFNPYLANPLAYTVNYAGNPSLVRALNCPLLSIFF